MSAKRSRCPPLRRGYGAAPPKNRPADLRQRAYLVVFSAFLGTVGESFVIDTDHWRHFWMMIGAIWAMVATTAPYTHAADRASDLAA